MSLRLHKWFAFLRYSWLTLLQQVRGAQLSPLPIYKTLHGYNTELFKKDLRAGINVALLAFPQAIAYAIIAGLPIKYGVYCAAVSGIVGSFFCSSRHTVMGPTNATAVMLLSVFQNFPPGIDRLQATAFVVILVGVFLIIASIFQFSSMLKFISRSVIIGYISGAALLIISNQIHQILGFPIRESSTMLEVLWHTAESINQTHFITLALGVATFFSIWAIKKYLPQLPNVAIGLILASFVGVGLVFAGFEIPTAAAMPSGFWSLTLPPANYKLFYNMVAPALAVAFLALMETSIMAKTISSRSGQIVNTNQEFLGLGLANIASGFLSGMPASASPTRSALNYQSGAVSPISALVCGSVCLLGALFIGPLTHYIPKTALAAVVIYVAISLLDWKLIRIAFRSTKSDAVVLLATFIASILLPLDIAIFLGVTTSIALFLRKASSPTLIEYSFNDEGNLAEIDTPKKSHPHISIIHVEGELFFGAADLFRDEIRHVCRDPDLRAVILRMRNARNLDATSIMALEELILYLRSTGRYLLLSGATKDVYRIMRDTGVLNVLGRENFFLGSIKNPNLATRNALKRAQHLLGDEKTDVKIFFDPAHAAKKKA
ncbi:MAG: SulP family inorganic anion transporter [Chthoniobacterales bacterium]